MSTSPDGIAVKIEEEFDLFCRRFTGFPPEKDHAGRLWFKEGFHAASKPLMEENERLNNFCKEFVYGEENPEYYKTMDEQIKELREALDKATLEILADNPKDKMPGTHQDYLELRLKFNLDNKSKGEKV